MKNIAVFTLSIAFTLILAACAHQPTNTAQVKHAHGVSEFKLNNGLKLLVNEDHRAPLVVSQVWYRVGAADEHLGITGIAHLLEHMMFKGTAKYSGDEFTRTIKRYGGRSNAFTGHDYTAYFQVFEKSRLAVSFELESDRMTNLILKPEDLAKERKVVEEERRWRVDDKPESRLREQLFSVALDNSPYQNPIIGWMDDITGISLGDLKTWYDNWYAPNNATVVVVGDVDADEVFALAQKYFGPIPARSLPAYRKRNESAQQGERRIAFEIAAIQPHLAIGYRAPRTGATAVAWHPYALWVLADILGGSRSARFNRSLVRGEEIAQYVGVSYSPYSRYDDLFYINAAPVIGTDIKQLERGIERELQKLRDHPVSAKELATVKARIIAQEVFRRDSIRHQAYMLGSLEVIGTGWAELFELREKIEQITPQQVMAVARHYFSKQNRSVAILEPQGK